MNDSTQRDGLIPDTSTAKHISLILKKAAPFSLRWRWSCLTSPSSEHKSISSVGNEMLFASVLVSDNHLARLTKEYNIVTLY